MMSCRTHTKILIHVCQCFGEPQERAVCVLQATVLCQEAVQKEEEMKEEQKERRRWSGGGRKM